MENKDQNASLGSTAGDSGVGGLPSVDVALEPNNSNALSLTPVPEQAPVIAQSYERRARGGISRFFGRVKSVLVVVLVLALGGLLIWAPAKQSKTTPLSDVADKYNTVKVELKGFVTTHDRVYLGSGTVSVNGVLQANNGLIIAPGLQPADATAGQLYYDQKTNLLEYYNGTEYITLQNQKGVDELGGLRGQIGLGVGLATGSGRLTNTGVLSVQGQTGDVAFVGGNGISLNGTTITNEGVISVASSTPNLAVANDGNGNVTLSLVGSGTGTVTSAGGTAGRIAKFTGAQNIADSLISESGAAITISGDLSVTGTTALGSPLTVPNGGTGAANLAGNGVLVGNGASAITSLVAGGAGLCLTSTLGSPVWASCVGATGVTSVNGLTGALTIANATGLVNTITIDDASTSNKGIVQFNSTNFSVVTGIANTVQDINTTASPNFNGLTLAGDIAVNGNDITSTGVLNITPTGALTAGSASQTVTIQGNASSVFRATSGANTTTLSFQTPTANVNYRLPTAAVGTYDICTTTGNCAGVGGSVTTTGGTAGTIPVFTGSQVIGDSLLSQSAGVLVTNGSLNVAGAGSLQTAGTSRIDASGNLVNIGTLTLNGAISGGTTVTGSGNINTTTGALQTNSTTRVDNSGNLTNIGNLTLSGAISGGTTIAGSGNINTSGGAIQTNGTSRIDNGGNLVNIGTITAGGSATLQGGNVTLGTTTQAGSVIISDGSSNTGTIQTAALGQNTTYTLPDPGVANVTICLSSGNCSGSAVTLQGAYDNSSNPEITLDATRGALTVRDNATPIGANLLEVQNNAGTTTYFAVTTSGASVTGAIAATGTINTTTGTIQTNGTTRIDNSGNLANIGTLTLSGAISGGTTVTGSGNFNTTAGALQTNSITRVDNTGNLVNIGTITASGSATLQGGSLTLGTTSQAGTLIIYDGSSNTGTVQVAALGQDTVYTLPDPGSGTATICLTTGNCAGTGTGVTSVTGGSVNRLAKFTAAQNVENSTITDNGTTVTTSVDLVVQGGEATIGVSNTQTGTLIFADSGSAFLGSIVQAALGASRTYTLPDATGTFCLTSGNCLGGAGGGANTALSNLTSVAINTTLLPGTAGTVNLGSGTLPFGEAFLAGTSGTPGTNNFKITGASTSGTRVITLPDATGTVCLQSSASCGFAPASGSANYIQNQIAADQTADFRISGDGRAATLNATTGLNTGVGAGTQRVDASGNLVNIGTLTLSGAISGGTSVTGSGNFNTTGGALQTNSMTRIDNGGNLTNIGSITASGNATLQGGSLTLGTASQAGSLIINDGSSNTGTVQVAALGQNTIYTIPDPGAGTATVCLTTGNCAGLGGTVGGTGTANKLAKFTVTGSTIGDSTISDNGTTVTTSVDIVVQGGDATIGVSNTQTGTLNLADSGSAFLGSITVGTLTAARTYTLPDASGDICLSSGNCLGPGGSGANINLSNLSSVAINTSLLPGLTTIDLGSNSAPFRDLYLGGAATNNFKITGTASAARTVTLDDLSGHIALIQTAGSSSAQTGDLSVSGTLIAGTALQGTLFKSADGAGASSAVVVRSGATTGGTGLSTGAVMIQSGDGSGTNTSSGNVSIDTGAKTGSGTNGSVAIGGTNASALTLGRSGLTTSNAGALTVAQLLTASGGVSVAANQSLTLQNGSGVLSQTYSSASASSAFSQSVTNSNAGASSVALNAYDLTLVGTATSGGINSNSAIKFENPSAVSNNNFYGLNFAGTGYTDILRVNGVQIINGSGVIQSAGISGSYTGITGVGTLATGALGVGFTTVAVGQGGTGATSFTGNGVLYGNNTGAIQATAAGATGQCLVGTTGAAPSWTTCTGLVTLQNAYNNTSSQPEITLDSTRGALTVRDNATPIGANLFEVQNSAGSTTYFGVTSSGVSVTGTTASSGTINTTGGTIQTNSVDRISNGGNLVNIGTITTSGAINSQTISSAANFTGTVTIQGANALTVGTTGTSTGAILFKGSTAASGTITLVGQANPGTRTITLPDETGIVCTSAATSTSNCTNFAPATGSTVYATRQLDNLTSVALNTSLLPGLTTIDLGSGANAFRDLYLGGTATNNFRFTGTASVARTYTLDDLSGRVALVQTAGSSSAQTGDINASGTVIAGTALQGTLVKTADGAGASAGITFRSGNTTGGSGLSTGAVTIQSGDGSGTNTNSGNVSIDSGTKTGSGTTGSITIGGTNASSIGLGHSGITTTNAGALTVTQLLTASGGVSVAGNQNVTLANGTGVLGQTFTNNVASSAQTLSVTNSNSGVSSIAVNGASITLVGTATSGGINSNSAINFANPAAAANNNFYGLNFAGTGYTDILRVNSTQIINGSGVIQSAGVSGSYTGITGVGTLTTGTLGAGFTTVAATVGGTGQSSYAVGDLLYANSTTTLAKLADVATGSCLVSGGVNTAPNWASCSGLVTLQNAYNNSTSPEITLGSGATAGLTVRDNATPIAGNLLEIQNNNASTTYFAVSSSGIQTTGTNTSSGTINTTGGTVQTSSIDRISNGGNLVNIGTITTSGAINSQTISSAANFTGTVTIQGANALTVGTTGTSTGAILFKGSTAASGTITLVGQANPGTRTITLPDETGTVCTSAATSTSNCTNFAPATGSTVYATRALDNLASVNINAALGFQSNQAANINFNGAAAAAGNLLSITGQTAGATANNGGAITIQGGIATTTGTGGLLTLSGGNTTATGTNGGVAIDAGSGATAYNGTITVGNAFASTISVGSTTLAAGTQTVNIGANNTAGSTTNVTVGSGSSATGGTTTVRAKGALTLTGGAASTWDVNGTLSLQTTNNGAITTGTGLLTQGGNVTFSGTTARTITGPSTGGLTMTVASGPLTLSTTTSGTLAVTSAGALNLTGAAASTWDIGANTLSLQTTNNGAITTGTGLLTQGGNITFSGTTARTITGPTTGGLTINDTGGNLTLSTTTSGTLAVTSAGALNLTGAAASTLNVGANTLAVTSSNLNVSTGGVLNVVGGSAGFQIGGAAATGNYLRGNGTSFVSSAIAFGDIPTCGGTCNYIGNQTSQQSSANFNILSAAAGSIGGLIQGAASQTAANLVLKGGSTPGANADLLQLQTSAATVAKIDNAGDFLAGGAATVTTATTSGTGTNTTTVTLTGAAFANNDVIFIDNAGQDFYTRIVSGGGTATLTVSPAVTFENTRTVTKYTVQNIGATQTDYTTQSNRFFQGYFLGGVVTGSGSTIYADQNINSSGSLGITANGVNITRNDTADELEIGDDVFNLNDANTRINIANTANDSYIRMGESSLLFGFLGWQNSINTMRLATFGSNDIRLETNSTVRETISGAGVVTFATVGSSGAAGFNVGTTQNGTTGLQPGNVLNATLNPGGSASASYFANEMTVDIGAAGTTFTGDIIANLGQVNWSGATNSSNTGKLYGTVGKVVTAAGAGTVQNAVALMGQLQYASTVTNSYDVYASNLQSGSTTNLYGFYAEQMTGGTNNYPLYLASATAGQPLLSVNGTGATTFANSTNSTAAFQVQNAIGLSALNIDTTTTNVITNPSFETNTTGWAAKGAASLSRITTQYYDNNASLQAATTVAVGDGAKYAYALASSTQYSFSVNVKTDLGGFNTFEIGYSNDGSTDTSCSTNLFGETAKWARYYCTFTTGATSGSPYVYIKQISGAVRNIYIDAASLETGATASQYRNAKISVEGSLALNVGQVTASSSNAVLLVQSNGGGNGITIKGNTDGNVLESALKIQTADGTDIFNVSEASKGALIQGGSSFFSTAALWAQSTSSSARALDVQGASGQTTDILRAKDSDSNTLLAVGPTSGSLLGAKTDYTAGTNPFGAAYGDFNKDGSIDMAVANNGANTVSIFIGNGSGGFATKVDYATSTNPRNITVADFDNDGDPDLGITNAGTTTFSVLLNNGSGVFSAGTAPTTATTPFGIASGDFNKDGKMDVVVANNGSTSISVFMGNGNGTFVAKVDYTTASAPRVVAVGDFNKDGAPDIAVTDGGSAKVSVFINNGNGTFAAKVDYTTGTNPNGIVSGDLNNDGSPDLALVNDGSDTLSVLMNNGNGTFATRVDYTTGSTPRAVALADMNKDGRPDLVVTDEGPETISAFLNNGNGTFAAKVDYTTGTNPNGIALADFDKDGAADVAVANNTDGTMTVLLSSVLAVSPTASPTLTLYTGGTNDALTVKNADGTQQLRIDAKGNLVLGNSTTALYSANSTTGTVYNSGLFADKALYSLPADADGATYGDFNKDGNVDMAVSGGATNMFSVFMGKGDGTFGTRTDYTNGSVTGFHLAAVDVDKDGDLDIAVTNRAASTVSIFLNNGSGVFSFSSNPATGTNPEGIVAVDVDKDGDPDLVTANGGAGINTVSVLTNNGSGTFSLASSPAAGTSPEGITAGDFDKDGDPDLAVVDSGGSAVQLLINNGSGTFSSGSALTTNSTPLYVTAADFNKDGALDLAVSNWGGSKTVSVFINNGSGGFAAKVDYATGADPAGITSADFNKDGNMDMAVNNFSSTSISVFTGNGDGTFASKADAAFDDWAYGGLVAADFDNDGDPDLAAGTENNNMAVIFNTTLNDSRFKILSGDATLTDFEVSDKGVFIGNMNADSTGALLVLDTKNTTGDPTGVNGAMYYNSFYGRFRCYQNNAWVDCIGGSPKEYLRGEMRTVQNTASEILVGDHIKYANVQASAGSSASLDTTTAYVDNSSTGASVGRITLAAGKTYRLVGNIPYMSCVAASTNCELNYSWYNVTGATQLGSTAILAGTKMAADDGRGGFAEAIFTPAVTTLVELRIVAETSVTGIGYITAPQLLYPSFYIEVLSDGGSGGASAAEYMRSEMQTQQSSNVGAADHIKFDAVQASSGSSIALSTAAYPSVGRFTLAAGKTYRVSGTPTSVGFSAGTDCYVILQWYNVTGSAYFGTGSILESTTRTNNEASMGQAEGVITTGASTTIELRISTINAGCTISSFSYPPQGLYGQAFIEVLSDGTKIAQFQGATASVDGQSGYVPKPVAGQQGSLLLGDGTWSSGLTYLSGDLGIGISSPTSKLHVYEGTTGGASLAMFRDNVNISAIEILSIGSDTPLIRSGTNDSLNFAAGNSGVAQFTINADGSAKFQDDTASSSAFSVNNTLGNSVISIDTAGTNQNNLITNPSFETNTTGWAAKGTPTTFARDTTQHYSGNASLKFTTQAVANQGARYDVTLTDSTTYSMSFFAKLDVSTDDQTGPSIAAGYASDGATDTNATCSVGITYGVRSTSWQQVRCTFTTPASHSGTPFVYIKYGSAFVETYYIDGVLLQTDANTDTYYREGKVSIQGTVVSPLVIQNTTDSSAGLVVQNTTGSEVFSVNNDGYGSYNDNQILNPDFETNTTGWSTIGSGTTIARDPSRAWSGRSSLKLVTGAVAGAGVKYVTGNTGPTSLFNYSDDYYISFFARTSSGTISDLMMLYSSDGTTEADGCKSVNPTGNESFLSPTTVTSSWQRFTCRFNTGLGTLNSSAYIAIVQATSVASQTLYIDGVNIVFDYGNGFPTGYGNGSINLTGTVISPVTFRNKEDSTEAFTVQASAGNSMLQVDTSNYRVYVGDAYTSGYTTLLVADTGPTSSEPTGINGAMYYNSLYHSFRCYSDSAWNNCAINSIDHVYDFEDDFLSGTTVAAGATNITGVGDLGWNVTATTSCAVAYNQTGPALSHDHPGTLRLTTAAVSGNGCAMTQGGTAAGTPTLSDIIATNDVMKTSVAVGAATGTVRVGWTNSANNTAPTSGVYWEAANGTDTNWRYCYANNGAATCADNTNATPTITANTWVKLEIRIVSSTAVDFIYNGTRVSLTGITFDLGATNKLGPAYTCFASTTTAQNCYMDYFQWRGTVTTAGGR